MIKNINRIVFISILALALAASAALSKEDQSNTPANSPKMDSCSTYVDIMTPTQIANAFWDELAIQDSHDDQVEIVSKYLKLITMDVKNVAADRLDRLALGEGAFLTFQVEAASNYFSSLLEGNDLISSHAWDRMMQIIKRAYGDDGKALDMVNQFYDKFPPTENNYHGRLQQISNFSSQYITAGKPEQAVKLIIRELGDLPDNAPYNSYSLLSRYSEAINASPQKEEVKKIVTEKFSKLKTLNEKWLNEQYAAADDPILNEAMPSWYWRYQSVRKGESLRTARQRKLAELIVQLEKWLEE